MEGAPLKWRLFALLSALLDPLIGLLVCVPNVLMPAASAPRWNTPRRRRRGLIVILGGVEGPSVYQRRMAQGLLRGGWRGAVHIHPWGRGVPFVRQFRNLMSSAHHEAEAAAATRILIEYRREHASAPIGLLAMSGGCWIAVRAMEQLPQGVRVRAAVLIAPAISRGADFSRAMTRCERMHAIRGPGDAFYLGLGTTLLGSSDRRHGPCGGWLGWRRTPAGFNDVSWRPEWRKLGYLGNHTSSAAVHFITAVVAPLFR